MVSTHCVVPPFASSEPCSDATLLADFLHTYRYLLMILQPADMQKLGKQDTMDMYGGIYKAHSVNRYLLHVIWYALLQSKPVGVQSIFSVRRIGMYDSGVARMHDVL